MYSSILSLTSTLDVVGGYRHVLTTFIPEKGPGTHYIGGWVDSSARLDE